MAANFNNSAWFYDRLARLIFGKALIKAQVYLLQYVPADSRVLIAGGGTGWILEELVKIHPSGLQITYAEVSSKMMALSKKRNTGNNKITYLNDAVENIMLNNDFDVVITPFLLDNFTEPTLQKVFEKITDVIKLGGIWLNCSFQLTSKWWQRVLLKTMFIFFRLVCNIEASGLPEIKKQFNSNNYALINEKSFFCQFIITEIYRRGNRLA